MFDPQADASRTPGTPAQPNLHYNLATLMGMRILEQQSDLAIAELEVRPDLLQPWGFLHGGAIVSLADTLCGIGCAHSIDPTQEFFLTVELKVNFTRAVREGLIHGEARPINQGRQVQLWECRITDEAGKLIAYMTATQLIQKLPTKN